jgi:nucleoside-diphosphate-sugar epimerase
VTKCEAEKAVLEGGGTSLRLATVFGLSPRMRVDLLVNDFVYRSLNDGFLALFEKHFKRNFIHVRDVCRAFIFMINQGDKVKGNAFNVGLSSANLSKYELALKIKEYLPELVIFEDDFKQDPDKRNYIVSNAKLEGLGWKPEYSLDDGIKEIIKGFRMLYRSQQIHTNL